MTGTTCGGCLYYRTDVIPDAERGMCVKLPKHPVVQIEKQACPFYERANVVRMGGMI